MATRARAIGVAITVAAAAWAAFGVIAIERGEMRDNSTAVAALTILAGLSFVVAGLGMLPLVRPLEETEGTQSVSRRISVP